MQNYSASIEKVNKIVLNFFNSLQSLGLNNERAIQFAMYVLCKAKGECGFLTRAEEELSYYKVKPEKIIDVLNKIKDICKDNAKDILPANAELLIETFYKNSRWGEYIQPRELTDLVLTLMKEKGIKTVYNPFAGLASYGLADFIQEYRGQEINHSVSNLARMRLELNNYDYSYFQTGDSIANWDDNGAQCIVSTPPFSFRIDKDDLPIFGSRTADEYVIERFINSNSRYAFYVVPAGILFRADTFLSKLRSKIVDGNMLDMVVELPAGIYSGSGIATSLLIFDKERSADSPVLLIDAKECYKTASRVNRILDVDKVLSLIHSPQEDCCVSVHADDFRNKRYSWVVGHYIKDNEVVPAGYKTIALKDILEPARFKTSFNEKKGRLATGVKLSSEYSHFIRKPESFEEYDDLKYAMKIEEPVLIISRIGKMKANFCIASADEPIFVRRNLFAYRIVYGGISPEYLCLELSKKKPPFYGTLMASLSRMDFLEITVAFPSLDEQKHICQAIDESNRLSKAKEHGLLDLIEKMKSEYMIEVRNRKHDMKTPMVQLRNTLKLMSYFCEGLSTENSKILSEYIKRQQVALDTLSEIVRHLADEDLFYEPEILDIDRILSSLAVKEDNYRIEYNKDMAALNEAAISIPQVKIARADFSRLVNNIVSNAIEHGFTDKRNDYELAINLSVEGKYFVIEFSNNGTPMPAELDKDRFGMRGVKGKDSKGSGFGGHIVKSITEHYGGDYDLYTTERAGVIYTEVVVKIPIYQEYE